MTSYYHPNFKLIMNQLGLHISCSWMQHNYFITFLTGCLMVFYVRDLMYAQNWKRETQAASTRKMLFFLFLLFIIQWFGTACQKIFLFYSAAFLQWSVFCSSKNYKRIVSNNGIKIWYCLKNCTISRRKIDTVYIQRPWLPVDEASIHRL